MNVCMVFDLSTHTKTNSVTTEVDFFGFHSSCAYQMTDTSDRPSFPM